MTLNMHASLAEALTIVKAAGYRVSKPKAPQRKDRVGPTFVAEFADGAVTRMSTFTSLANLDVARGLRLSQAAYEARARRRFGGSLRPVLPPIVRARFERDGKTLASYDKQACSRSSGVAA